MDDIKLLSTSSRPCLVVVGVPQCWIDVRRVARRLVRFVANDNGWQSVAAGVSK